MTELLIVDDDAPLRRWAERVMHERGYTCHCAEDASAARELLQRSVYKLVLLDVNMPGESGIDLLSHIRSHHPGAAVLMVTGEDDPQLAITAIEQGAYGYLVKPVGSGELVINVANALHRRRRELETRRLTQRLQATVEDRGHRLEHALQDLQLSESKLWVSQAETIFRLARLVEFRDEETGHHLQRMSSYCEILARKLGLPEQHCELVRLASQLHDVGKVALPDSILLKHGKLTHEEMAVVQTHAETGYRMLAGSSSEVVQMGAVIARTHHERWDGTGYPRGLAAKDIPPEGRIAAIADVFDALTSDRIYRSAFPVRSAIDTMLAERSTHFDPHMLDAFLQVLPEVHAVRQTYLD
ncbi:MAG TPA: HD domain-containing phosphohydrolase [Solirubrobacteraceae bacterium]|nr:HD domain-containing phosphohydrolase [Solirubrobacteraceae bacterium]